MHYLRLVDVGRSPSGRTQRFEVRNQAGDVVLGWVSWYAPWRRYCFTPAPKTVFDAACLAELREELDAITDAHKAARKFGA